MTSPDSSPEQEPRPEMSEEGGKRIDHILHSIGSFVSRRTVSAETEHIGAQLSLQRGVNLYVHAGTDEASAVYEFQALKPGAFFLLSIKKLDDRDPEDQKYLRHLPDDALIKISKQGIQIATNAAQINDDPEMLAELPTEKADSTQVLSLSLFINTLLRKKTDDT